MNTEERNRDRKEEGKKNRRAEESVVETVHIVKPFKRGGASFWRYSDAMDRRGGGSCGKTSHS